MSNVLSSLLHPPPPPPPPSLPQAAAPYPLVQTLRLVGPEGAAGVVATSASLTGDRLLVGVSAGYHFPGVVVGCPTLLAFEDY